MRIINTVELSNLSLSASPFKDLQAAHPKKIFCTPCAFGTPLALLSPEAGKNPEPRIFKLFAPVHPGSGIQSIVFQGVRPYHRSHIHVLENASDSTSLSLLANS